MARAGSAISICSPATPRPPRRHYSPPASVRNRWSSIRTTAPIITCTRSFGRTSPCRSRYTAGSRGPEVSPAPATQNCSPRRYQVTSASKESWSPTRVSTRSCLPRTRGEKCRCKSFARSSTSSPSPTTMPGQNWPRSHAAGISNEAGFRRSRQPTWLLRDGEEPRIVRFRARYVRQLREPTVFEMHLQAWLAPVLSDPAWNRGAPLGCRRGARSPPRTPQEGWGRQGTTDGARMRHPLSPKSEHRRRSAHR